MFEHIMVPVDLAHPDKQSSAVKVAGDLAGHYGAQLTFVGVTSGAPSATAHSPEEYAEKLAHYTATQAELSGITTAQSHAVTAHDPSVDLDRMLEAAVHDIGADLVVMASHIPKRFDFGSHGGRVATHTDASVMLIRI